MTTPVRSRALGYTLLLVNAAGAAVFLILAVASSLAVFAEMVGGVDEPEDALGWLFVLSVAVALFACTWATTGALARSVRGEGKGGTRPAIYGAILLLLLGLLVAFGVSIGTGGAPLGMLLMIPLVGLVAAALYLW